MGILSQYEANGRRKPAGGDRTRVGPHQPAYAGRSPSCTSADGFAHAAVLVLLATVARTRFVAADLRRPVADRLGLLLALLAAGDGLLLLVLDAARLRQHALGLLVRRRPDRPDRLLEPLLLL